MFHHSLVGCPWTSDLTSPSVSFPIGKMEGMTEATAEVLRLGLLAVYIIWAPLAARGSLRVLSQNNGFQVHKITYAG